MAFHSFDDDMFSSTQKIKFHQFKNGEHRFRILPPFAKGQLYLQVDLHWGFLDENNQKKVLKCTKYSHKTCAICDEADRMTDEIKMLENNPGTMTKEELDLMVGDKKKRRDDIKRKATYLWNILTESNEAKVLQLSWNGHEPLMIKTKFLWNEMKINVTDPNASQQMWCSRTGMNAGTRYTYEMIANSARPLEGITEVTDLAKVYKDNTPAELQQAVKLGYVPNSVEDPNDRSFAADMPMVGETKTPPPATTTVTQTTQAAAPVTETPFNTTAQAAAPVTQATVVPVTTPAAPVVTANVEDDIAKMEAILKQGNQGVF